jgi:hypothetical protein
MILMGKSLIFTRETGERQRRGRSPRYGLV